MSYNTNKYPYQTKKSEEKDSSYEKYYTKSKPPEQEIQKNISNYDHKSLQTNSLMKKNLNPFMQQETSKRPSDNNNIKNNIISKPNNSSEISSKTYSYSRNEDQTRNNNKYAQQIKPIPEETSSKIRGSMTDNQESNKLRSNPTVEKYRNNEKKDYEYESKKNEYRSEIISEKVYKNPNKILEKEKLKKVNEDDELNENVYTKTAFQKKTYESDIRNNNHIEIIKKPLDKINTANEGYQETIEYLRKKLSVEDFSGSNIEINKLYKENKALIKENDELKKQKEQIIKGYENQFSNVKAELQKEKEKVKELEEKLNQNIESKMLISKLNNDKKNLEYQLNDKKSLEYQLKKMNYKGY